MDLATFLWTTLAVILTIAVFSFLYKENPLYRFAEHLVVGVSAGYFAILLFHTSLFPNLFQKLIDGNYWYLIPGALGILMWSRFLPKYAYLSRLPLAVTVGIGAGIAIPLELTTRVMRQLFAVTDPISWTNFWGTRFLDPGAGIWDVMVFLGTIAGLVYFFFSLPHKGVFGGVAKFGIWVLMLGFGASFGFTVMARISLLINRMQYVHLTWIQNAYGTSTQAGNGMYIAIVWVVIAMVVGYVVYEIIASRRRVSSEA